MRWLLLLAVLAVGAWWFMRALRAGQSGPVGSVQGPGKFEFDIVGEGSYQPALRAIAGRKTEEGVEHHCTAVLILEDSNPYDDKAVRVDIDGRTVGYLSRKHARQYRKQVPVGTMTVDAMIVGGWNRGGGDVGHYGVKLDLPMTG
jgi:hypothetical protein